jgi:hypothetical protein
MYSPPTSHLNVTSTRIRTRTTQRNQHHQYMDSLLRVKCPRSRIHALNVVMQFRDDYGADEAIPNDLLDELLESTGDRKYIFCCQRDQKARSIAGARDLVRKSLGNFPFRCSNLGWCVKLLLLTGLRLIIWVFQPPFVSPASRSQQTHEDLQIPCPQLLTK